MTDRPFERPGWPLDGLSAVVSLFIVTSIAACGGSAGNRGGNAAESLRAPVPPMTTPGAPASHADLRKIVDSVVLDEVVDLSMSPCLGQPNTVDARGSVRLAGNTSGGLNVGDGIGAPPGGCLVGAAVRARWSRDLGWKEAGHAGDGVVFGDGGTTTIHGAYIDNFADGIGPPKSPKTNRSTKWVVKNVYARYNRDDFVENDACLEGVVHDTLVDGTFAFISNRPGKHNQEFMARYKGNVSVTNSLVYMQCQPGTFGPQNCGPSLDMGQIFKWSACGGPVTVRDTIIYVDPNDTRSLLFPEGTYGNVHVIWPARADKEFPAAPSLPSGVTLSRDVSLWRMARKKWMDRHGCDEKGDHCTMTDK